MAAARCHRFEDQLMLTVVRKWRAGRSGYIGDDFYWTKSENVNSSLLGNC